MWFCNSSRFTVFRWKTKEIGKKVWASYDAKNAPKWYLLYDMITKGEPPNAVVLWSVFIVNLFVREEVVDV